jgi:hypothetical protein
MIDNGPLKSKSKYSGGFGFKLGKKRKGGLPVLKRPSEMTKQAPNRSPRTGSGFGVAKPPVDYTSPANKGLVKAATPERQAAVASELAKLNANKNLSGSKKSQRSDLLREQKKRGWA